MKSSITCEKTPVRCAKADKIRYQNCGILSVTDDSAVYGSQDYCIKEHYEEIWKSQGVSENKYFTVGQ